MSAIATGESPEMLLFKKSSTPVDVNVLAHLRDLTNEAVRIRCPACQWRPDASSLWTCVDHGHPEYFDAGCGTSWNTFDTRGRCPDCAHQWQWTACLVCGTWSLHDDWYDDHAEG